MNESQKNSDTKIVSHAKVGIIGGGIMGVSLLYHLAKEGWKDLVLFEKGELTSGSTWHAAGQCPQMMGSYNLAKIHLESTNLYKTLEKETEQPTGFHECGSLRIAYKQEDLGWFNNTFLSRFSTLTPHFIFQKQAESEQLNIGGLLSSDHLGFGLGYRRGFNNSDALIILLGYETQQNSSSAFFQGIKIGYSYDLTLSKLGISSGGSHEISLRMQLPCIYISPTQNTIPCPKF